MKKCPNCGAMMAEGVNFCTNCGADLRQVATFKEETAQQTAAVETPQPQQEPVNSQPVTPNDVPVQQTRTQNVPNQPSAFAGYWEWIVSSWKQPTQEVKTEKWYGIVNLLIEIALFTIGFWRLTQAQLNNGINKTLGSFSQYLPHEATDYGNQQVGNISGKVFLFLVIATAIMIALSVAAHNFVYKTQIDVMSYINRIAQYSNYVLIINLVVLVLGFLGSSAGLVYFLGIASALIFVVAVLVPVLADGQAVGDKAIGGMIAMAGFLLAIAIGYFMLRSEIASIFSSLTSLFK